MHLIPDHNVMPEELPPNIITDRGQQRLLRQEKTIKRKMMAVMYNTAYQFTYDLFDFWFVTMKMPQNFGQFIRLVLI